MSIILAITIIRAELTGADTCTTARIGAVCAESTPAPKLNGGAS